MTSKVVLYLMTSLAIIFSIALIPGDLEFIPADQVNYYLVGRFATCAINIFLMIFYHYKKKETIFVSVYLITMILYSFHGQWFIPGYYLGFAEMIVLVGLFFPLKKSFYQPVLVVSFIIMSFIIWNSPASYAVIGSKADIKFRLDAIIAIFIISACAFVGHIYITLKRQEKDEAYRKFLDIGKYSSFLFHDFKGLLTTPIFYADMLTETIRSGGNPNEVLAKLNEDLNHIQEYSKEFMKLTIPNSPEYQNNEPIALDQIEKTLNVVLRKHLNGINFSFNSSAGTPVKVVNNLKIIKVLYNAVINSVEYLHQNQIKNPSIEVCTTENSILVKDNGKGFSTEVLKKINQEDVIFTTKKGGTGIGTAIIKDLAKNLNADVKFYNKNGAIVEIIFN